MALTALAAVLTSVRYDAATHRPKGSAGCGQASPYKLGVTTVATAKHGGAEWTFRVYVPAAYDSSTPLPLILQHPGWGVSAASEEEGAGITALADRLGFVSVTPQGMDDNSHNGGPWYSWNAVGSTRSPGPDGPTCTADANYPTYCYESCGASRAAADAASDASYASYTYGSGGGGSKCKDTPQCWWTTCDDAVTPSGTGLKPLEGFIPSLYDTLESQLCIDVTREYASGESNGGMMTYQLGVDMAARLAAISPEFGSFHRGFAMAPSEGVPVLDLHGTRDTTVRTRRTTCRKHRHPHTRARAHTCKRARARKRIPPWQSDPSAPGRRSPDCHAAHVSPSLPRGSQVPGNVSLSAGMHAAAPQHLPLSPQPP